MLAHVMGLSDRSHRGQGLTHPRNLNELRPSVNDGGNGFNDGDDQSCRGDGILCEPHNRVAESSRAGQKLFVKSEKLPLLYLPIVSFTNRNAAILAHTPGKIRIFHQPVDCCRNLIG